MDRSCTAVIFGYSPDTVQAIDILRERKLRPEHDLSIISFDDIKLFELLTPSLSVISQQLDKMGLIAAQGILDLIPQQSNSDDNNASTGTDADAKSVDAVVHSSTRLHTRIPTVFIRRDSVRTV
jgi:DNA-binding LacI/PurR family transcriptional regulator